MDQETRAFLEQYERANSESDISGIADLYADSFMFGGPQGVQSVKRDDFLKVIPRRKEHFRSIGLLESKVISLDEVSLDSKYVLAKTVWRMSFKKSPDVKMDTETSATFILERKGKTLRIVFQIDHQDLTARVEELGLA